VSCVVNEPRDYLLEGPIKTFTLAIGLWVITRGTSVIDGHTLKVAAYCGCPKLQALVRDDHIRISIAREYVSGELLPDLEASLAGHGVRFCPASAVINDSENVLVA
jgi:hypothetical protein